MVTAQEDEQAGTPDPVILSRAHVLGRAVLTHHRRDDAGVSNAPGE